MVKIPNLIHSAAMRSGGHTAVAGACAVPGAALPWLGVLIVLAGCATGRPVWQNDAVQPKVALSMLPPGAVAIIPGSQVPNITLDPPSDRLESAGEGAAAATRSVLNTPDLGHPQLEAAVGVVQFVAAPFAAAYGAVRAHQHRLTPDQLQDSEAELRQMMTANARPEMLCDKVAEAAQQRTRRLLVSAVAGPAAPAIRDTVSALLELDIEQLDLKTSAEGKKEYTLRIEARALLRRCSDNSVLLDRRYHYESGPALFIDWASEVGFNSVAESAYRSLAEQIADDIFQPRSEPPLLIGPGQEHSNLLVPAAGVSLAYRSSTHRDLVSLTSKGSGRTRLVSRTVRAAGSAHGAPVRPLGFIRTPRGPHDMPIQLRLCAVPVGRRLWAVELTNSPVRLPGAAVAPTNPVPREAAAIAVFTGKPDDRLRSPPVAPEPGSAPGDMTETEWRMDGLENDRNAVVQAAACLAAVPFGLWEQTVGAVGRRSRDQANDLARSLNEIPERSHFDELMADQVARRLRSQVANQVERTDEPLKLAFTRPGLQGETDQGQPPAGRAGEVALEIQVVSARLLPARRRGQSMALCVEALVTVIRSVDGQELYARPVRYRSSPKRLKDWAASDASALRQELDACSQTTAEALARDLIHRGFLVPGSQPAPPLAP